MLFTIKSHYISGSAFDNQHRELRCSRVALWLPAGHFGCKWIPTLLTQKNPKLPTSLPLALMVRWLIQNFTPLAIKFSYSHICMGKPGNSSYSTFEACENCRENLCFNNHFSQVYGVLCNLAECWKNLALKENKWHSGLPVNYDRGTNKVFMQKGLDLFMKFPGWKMAAPLPPKLAQPQDQILLQAPLHELYKM